MDAMESETPPKSKAKGPDEKEIAPEASAEELLPEESVVPDPAATEATGMSDKSDRSDRSEKSDPELEVTEPTPAMPPAPVPPALAGGARRRVWNRRHLKLLVAYPVLTALIAVTTGVVVAASIQRPVVEETLEDFVPRLITRLFDSEGELVRSYSRENRILLQEGDLPEVLKNAVMAIEDADFYHHGGVDLWGVIRAAVTNLRAGRIEEGGSTITMQLARELFSLTREKSIKRKFEEAFLAVELEKKFSKQQILTMYCNMVNLSQGNYGMEAAARNYFGVSVNELSLAQAATLAGIPQRPTHYNPYARREAVQNRRDIVLSRMLAEEFITREDYEQAVAEPLVVKPKRWEKHLGPYFSEEVRRYLIATYGETELYDRGLQVYTTLDRRIQDAAEAALKQELVALDHERGWRGAKAHLEMEDLENQTLPSWSDLEPAAGDDWYEGVVLESGSRKARVRIADTTWDLTPEGFAWTKKKRPSSLLKKGDVAWFRLAAQEGGEPLLILEQEPEMEAAVVVLESASGAVRAIVGGWDYERNEFNRATQARRQVGSAFKPFVFGAALEIGFTAADTVFDGPVVFPATREETYSPRNFYRKYNGVLTLRRALEKSINVPAVKLLDMMGAEQVVDFARRCGITSDLPPYPSLALGASDIRPIELAGAYAAFANQGVFVEPYLIEKVTSRNGRMMQEHAPRAHKAMDPAIAYVLTHMLQGAAKRGTGSVRLAKIELPVAGKTGTTNRYTDAWFAGFTPRYTILTWVGHNEQRSLGRNMTGAHAALPIWHHLVQRGLEEGWLDPKEEFEVPPGIIEREIEARSGLLIGEEIEAEAKIAEVFVEGTEPEKFYENEMADLLALPWYLQEPFYLPKEGERMPDEVADWTQVLESWEEKDTGKKKTDESPAEGDPAATR